MNVESSTELEATSGTARPWVRFAAIWGTYLVVTVGIAARQEHPSDQVPLVAAVLALLAVLVTFVQLVTQPHRARRDALVSTAIAAVAVGIGMWNPMNLYVITLVLGHPFVGGAAVALFSSVVVLRWDGEPGRMRYAISAVLQALAAAALLFGCLAGGAYLLFGRTGYSSSSSAGGSVRIDFHQGGDCNDGTSAVIRSGSGLLLRQGPASTICSGNDWSLVNDHLVVVTCNIYSADPIHLEAYLALDPDTLDVIGETRPQECRGR